MKENFIFDSEGEQLALIFLVMPFISAYAFYSIAFVESSAQSVCSENHLKLL